MAGDTAKGARLQAGTGCPMDGLLRLVSGPWTTYILWLLIQHESLRFSALKKAMPLISAKMLTERLRLLEQNGLVNRHYEPTIPPTVSYSLTTRGRELKAALDSLHLIALRWREQDHAPARPSAAE